jgi:hypothetical protein
MAHFTAPGKPARKDYADSALASDLVRKAQHRILALNPARQHQIMHSDMILDPGFKQGIKLTNPRRSVHWVKCGNNLLNFGGDRCVIFHMRLTQSRVCHDQQGITHQPLFRPKMIHDENQQIAKQTDQATFTLPPLIRCATATILTRRKIAANMAQDKHAVEQYLMLDVNFPMAGYQLDRQWRIVVNSGFVDNND